MMFCKSKTNHYLLMKVNAQVIFQVLEKKTKTERCDYMRDYMRAYRARMPSGEQKAKNNAYQKKHRASTCKTSTNEKDIEFTISKFLELTAQGPLYICTCRDQLWYKNGVLCAKNLRQSNSNMS